MWFWLLLLLLPARAKYKHNKYLRVWDWPDSECTVYFVKLLRDETEAHDFFLGILFCAI